MSGDGAAHAEFRDDLERLGQTLQRLEDARGAGLPAALVRLVAVIAEEAGRSNRFATALQQALAGEHVHDTPPPRRAGRRDPGAFDPFGVYANGGEPELRQRLGKLTLEQLRDMVAEHGMDQDRLAMKWKDPSRVIDRIVERVIARAAKGSAFRDS